MKRFKKFRDVLEDAAMIVIGLSFAVHMSSSILKRYNLTLYELFKTLVKMPSDLWQSDGSLFCALGLLVTGLGLAMAGWAFLSDFLESKNIAPLKWFKVKTTV